MVNFLYTNGAKRKGSVMEQEIKKILIVDDAMYVHNLKEAYLKRKSCKILKASEGEEALHVIVKERPDLIIMDLSMPLVNGEECCKVLKNHPDLKDIPIIMLANAWDRDAEKRCRNAGCDDFIQKPLDRRRLYSAIKRFLNIAERKHTRVPYEAEVVVASGGIEYGGVISNISAGGMFVRSDDLHESGSDVEAIFRMRGLNAPVRISGEVVWIADNTSNYMAGVETGMGIRFHHLPAEVKDIINKLR